jgi:hypothetical protein
MNGVKEIKIDSINFYIFDRIKKIRHYIYGILEIIGAKTDKNYNNEIDNNEINKKIEELWKNSTNILRTMNNALHVFNDKRYAINSDYLKLSYISNKSYNKLYQYNNLYYLLYKNIIISTGNFFLRSLIKNELRDFEIQMIRIRNINFLRQKNLESKTINDLINEFITNDFKDKINQKQSKEINEEKKCHNIYFNCNLELSKGFAYIKIEILNFHIYIKFPNIKYFNSLIFFDKIKVIVKLKYDISDDTEYPYEIYNNGKIYEVNEKKIKKFLLIDKIQNLIQNRICQINQAIFEDTKSIKSDNMGKSNLNHLIEFCKRFLYYIHDYTKLYETKCAVCQKIVKYSINEKCFFPPYYKIYRDRTFIDIGKNSEDNGKLFCHEECLRKIALPYL